MVYEIPTPEPETLRQFILNTATRNHRPSLGDLFDLATKIVRCVLEVHKVGWIHKSISSHNIFFFKCASPSSSLSVRSPYLVGFNYSREDSWQAFTNGLDRKYAVDLLRYHHPQYMKKGHGYQPEYDFYSVGVVLLEIGRWHPLSQILSKKTFKTPIMIKQLLLDECNQNLSNSMGDLYRDATAACLMSNFVLDRGRDEMRTDFEEKVLNRLARCRV
jgi:serine/threonine protein kinase